MVHLDEARDGEPMRTSQVAVACFFGGLIMVLPLHVITSQSEEIAELKSQIRSKACARNTFPAKVLRVVDGDTLDLEFDQGLGDFSRMRVRLKNVDTPEVRGEDKARGDAATEFTRAWIAYADGGLEATDFGWGKYPRRIVELRRAGERATLAEALVVAGHVK